MLDEWHQLDALFPEADMESRTRRVPEAKPYRLSFASCYGNKTFAVGLIKGCVVSRMLNSNSLLFAWALLAACMTGMEEFDASGH